MNTRTRFGTSTLLAGCFLLALPGPIRGQATNSEVLRSTMGAPAPRQDVPHTVGPEAPSAATPAEDTASQDEGLNFRRTVTPAALITLGLFTFKDEGFLSRQSIREWRNEFIPDFEDHLDDYGQFAAGALALGLNAVGVKGKHSLGRSAATYATSMAVMTLGIHTIKNLADVRRPDGSNNESFPSGHTAASFASARFLDREYGEVSYLYSLGGYSFAALTGVFRQLNNKHWLSDVLVGAGIGLMSTDVAYAIMDEVFGEKGMAPERPVSRKEPRGNPSFLDFRVGYAGHTGDVDDPDGPFNVGGGWTAGFEGAWFPWKNLGLGAESGVVSFPISTDNFLIEDPDLADVVEGLYTQPLGARPIYAGPFFDFGLSERWSLTGKATAGIALGATGRISAQITEGAQESVGSAEVPLLEYEASDTFGLALGAGVRAMVSERIGLRLFGEWNYSKPDYTISEVTGVNPDGTLITGEVVERTGVDFSYFAVGASVSAMVW